MGNKYFIHPVRLDDEKCKGCVTCMKRCPTEAIRVRDGKASVLYERCIGCGECVRLCPHHAKIPLYDAFETIDNYKYKIALPAPSLYGQFDGLEDVNVVLEALKRIGFDDVFEVGRAAELCSLATQQLLKSGKYKKPVISTACPAVLELIMMKFDNLKDNLLNLLAPVDVAAKLAREKAVQKGIPEGDIGVFFISPCPAKVAALKCGNTVDKPSVDGVLSCGEVYMKLLPEMKQITDARSLSKMGIMGLQWASSGGEAASASTTRYLAADGIENVMNILTSVEDNKLENIEFIELNACTAGCVGGVLNVENPFVAKARIRELRNSFPRVRNSLESEKHPLTDYLWQSRPEFNDAAEEVEVDRAREMNKLIEARTMYDTLPQIDCGLCGAPSCEAYCEDVVNGRIDGKKTMCPKKRK